MAIDPEDRPLTAALEALRFVRERAEAAEARVKELEAKNRELLQQLKEPLTPERIRVYARRYEKLRRMHWHRDSLCVVSDPKRSLLLGCFCPSEQELDDILDALP